MNVVVVVVVHVNKVANLLVRFRILFCYTLFVAVMAFLDHSRGGGGKGSGV